MAWILVTDVLLYSIVNDPGLIARVETAKGWFFVAAFVLAGFKLTSRLTHELALSEATNAALVASIADGVLLLGPDRTIASANPSAARILGVERSDDLTGMGPEEFSRRFHLSFPDGRIVAPREYVSQRAFDGEVPPPYKALLYPPGRPEVVIRSSAAPVRAAPGGPVEGAVSVMCDITEIEHLERTRNQFFASAAHALKTPISVIKAQLYLLRSSLSPMEHSLAILERQCGKIDRLSDDLLTLLRIRTGALRLRPEELELRELVDEAVRAMENAEPGLVAHYRARPRVFGDPERLGQALRAQIDIAFVRRRPGTDVELVLDEVADKAAISLTYEPIVDDVEADHLDDAGYGGLGVGTHVVESIIHMTGGVVRTRTMPGPRRTDTLELPTIPRGADDER